MNDMDDQEKLDHEFEAFVLEQVRRYGDMHEKSAGIYTFLVVLCFVLSILGLLLGKSAAGSVLMGVTSIQFIAARQYYKNEASEIAETADRMQSAIDDPDFDIPDDYTEDILALRSIVTPTIRNVMSQLIAYGILAVLLWGCTAIVVWLATIGSDVDVIILIFSFILAAMAVFLTMLAVRALKDIPVAKAYERYLNEAAAGRGSEPVSD